MALSAPGDDKLVAALLEPAAYPHPADEVRLLETHISWVFLAGEFAYKVKKPIRLSFLDFSTLDKRRHWCHEELRLNRRWAPTLYLEVVPVTGTDDQLRVGGAGVPVEYAVKMRRFPQSALLNEQLAAGELTEADMLEIAEMVAHRHADAPVNQEPRFGSVEAVRKPMRENFLYLRPVLDADTLEVLERWTEQEVERLAATLEARCEGGFVRECHGDLHLRNLVRLSAGIVAFDCIEFSEELHMLDVISDLSFLTMDLAINGRADLANRLLNRYLECSGDYAGMAVYRLYYVYHCLIRAKVYAIRADECDEPDERDAALAEMRHYVLPAHAEVTDGRPAVVVMHGLSGTGKTYVSGTIAACLGAVRIRSDIERKRMHGIAERGSSHSAPGGGLYAEDVSQRTYEGLRELTRQVLDAGHSVLLDAAFLRREERHAVRQLAKELGCGFLCISVEAPRAVLEERLRARHAAGSDASEADIAVLDYQYRTSEPLAGAELDDALVWDSSGVSPVEELAAEVERRLGSLHQALFRE